MSKNDKIFDDDAIEQLMQDFEANNENEMAQLIPTRASLKRRFSNLDEATLDEIQKTVEEFGEQFGLTSTKIRHLAQFEVDTLVEELMTVRKFNDILSAREETLKKFAKDIISLDQLEPDTTSGSLVSSKNKVRISKEIRGGKLSIDIDLLKKRLTPEQFASITNMVLTTTTRVAPDGKSTVETTTTYEVNEKFLEQEMIKGNILSEDVYLSSVASKRTSAIYIRELEN